MYRQNVAILFMTKPKQWFLGIYSTLELGILPDINIKKTSFRVKNAEH